MANEDFQHVSRRMISAKQTLDSKFESPNSIAFNAEVALGKVQPNKEESVEAGKHSCTMKPNLTNLEVIRCIIWFV